MSEEKLLLCQCCCICKASLVNRQEGRNSVFWDCKHDSKTSALKKFLKLNVAFFVLYCQFLCDRRPLLSQLLRLATTMVT